MKYSIDEIEEIIYSYLPAEEGCQVKVIEAMNYAFKAGGKRLRPLMMKLCFDMLGGQGRVVEPFMAAIEMIHTYSLIHDDLPALDNDSLRRGRPTVHVAFGEDIAILAGDGLLNYAFETAAKAFSMKPGDIGVEKAFSVLAQKPGIYGMIGGQTLDVLKSGKPLDENEIDFIYTNKTAALIECSMLTGAYLAGANEAVTDRLLEAARAVGLAFQVQDDILDIVGDEAVLGKPVLSDEKNEKYTFVTEHGMDYSTEYVRTMSEKANNILEDIDCADRTAKLVLVQLVNNLINREK